MRRGCAIESSMTALLGEVALFFEGDSLDFRVGPNDFETALC